ncbi:hypothetical protein [Paludisphaera rhizosphaerae]|uniref:hypothetical protein n=1 Tax=Paludisphaera rhizosphaerae TaxID=2711216 RepID=UPI0013EAC9FF|nr:hypothetical protein [Paludisphaera rhizosphaerae]
MATVLRSASKAKAAKLPEIVRCCDCRCPIEDETRAVLAPMPVRCDTCDNIREARTALEEIIDSADERLIEEALNWLQLALTDAAIFRSARARRILDDAVYRAIEVANVREVRDPVIVGGEDDYDF